MAHAQKKKGSSLLDKLTHRHREKPATVEPPSEPTAATPQRSNHHEDKSHMATPTRPSTTSQSSVGRHMSFMRSPQRKAMAEVDLPRMVPCAAQCGFYASPSMSIYRELSRRICFEGVVM
eukprot:m.89810 g.89810  ORF g.89810 m.89810 type:complete len:120 (-) comp14868_c3_seq6:1759-2118(-)